MSSRICLKLLQQQFRLIQLCHCLAYFENSQCCQHYFLLDGQSMFAKMALSNVMKQFQDYRTYFIQIKKKKKQKTGQHRNGHTQQVGSAFTSNTEFFRPFYGTRQAPQLPCIFKAFLGLIFSVTTVCKEFGFVSFYSTVSSCN